MIHCARPRYAHYRTDYPAAVFEHLRENLGLDGRQRALDLMCGIGQVTVPLASSVQEVVALDPAEDFLVEGRRVARERGVRNVHWRLGEYDRLPESDLGRFDLAVIADAFHCVDQAAVLSALDEMVRDDGAVVVTARLRAQDVPEPRWVRAITEVRARWGVPRAARSGSHLDDEDVRTVRDSPFGSVETVSWTGEKVRDVDEVIKMQLSFHALAPVCTGPKRKAFVADLRKALLATDSSGVFRQRITFLMIIATR